MFMQNGPRLEHLRLSVTNVVGIPLLHSKLCESSYKQVESMCGVRSEWIVSSLDRVDLVQIDKRPKASEDFLNRNYPLTRIIMIATESVQTSLTSWLGPERNEHYSHSSRLFLKSKVMKTVRFLEMMTTWPQKEILEAVVEGGYRFFVWLLAF